MSWHHQGGEDEGGVNLGSEWECPFDLIHQWRDRIVPIWFPTAEILLVLVAVPKTSVIYRSSTRENYLFRWSLFSIFSLLLTRNFFFTLWLGWWGARAAWCRVRVRTGWTWTWARTWRRATRCRIGANPQGRLFAICLGWVSRRLVFFLNQV